MSTSPEPTPIMAATLVVLLSIISYFIYQDYQAYLALGPGGTPSTFRGYMKVTWLSFWRLRDTYTPPPVPADLKIPGFMRAEIPKRKFDRPKVDGIAPHRQMTQRVSEKEEMYKRLSSSIANMAKEHKAEFYIGKSAFEGHCNALFAKVERNSKKKCEICHLHPIDGSMHVTLHFADMKIVLEKGWGGT
jgi:hypothetical protein